MSGSNSAPEPCPLCGSSSTSEFHTDRKRNYRRCPVCRLVFVPPQFHLTADAEKAEYDLHQNSPADEGYRKFLSRLFNPMLGELVSGASGLDFGCGPGPTLSVMFEEQGYEIALYDRFYYPDESVLERQYDFITATEVLEHLRQPMQELDRLWAWLKPGGVMGIMTKLVIDEEAFSNWHYKNDLTHISFFSRETFEWLVAHWQAELQFIGKDVILLRKGDPEVF